MTKTRDVRLFANLSDGQIDTFEVLNRRKALRGKGYVIIEDLTQENRDLLDTVFKKESIKQAWSSNGKIFGKKHDGELIKFEKQIKTYNFEHKLYNNMTGNDQDAKSDTICRNNGNKGIRDNNNTYDDMNSYFNTGGYTPVNINRGRGYNSAYRGGQRGTYKYQTTM